MVQQVLDVKRAATLLSYFKCLSVDSAGDRPNQLIILTYQNVFFFHQPTAKKDKKKRRPKKGKSRVANTILHAAKNGNVDQCQSNSAIPTNSCLEQCEATCQEMMFWRS